MARWWWWCMGHKPRANAALVAAGSAGSTRGMEWAASSSGFEAAGEVRETRDGYLSKEDGRGERSRDSVSRDRFM
uniref:DUF834 domain-containing protein n=1 Tax=Oryza glumipatula TaxID=40148 RepID=A0A0D9YCR6_9ORYZ